MTFSEKAAAEMRERICACSFDMYRETRDARWFDIYRALRDAHISTIHSFCRDLLLKKPLDAGLDPDFAIEPAEIAAREFVDDFLSEFLARSDENAGMLLRLIRKYSRRRLQDMLFRCFSNRQMYGGALRTCAKQDWQDLSARWQESYAQKWREFRNAIAQNIDEIAVRVKQPKQGHKWQWLLDNVPHREAPPDVCFLEQLKENLANLTLTKFPPVVWAFRKLVGEIGAGAEEIAFAAQDGVEFARLYTEFEDYVWRGHDRWRTVDFNELLIRAKALLEEFGADNMRAILPENILLDEFQDTSPIQWEIVARMKPVMRSILLVGDEKQSVYRFRGADVGIVREGEKLISERAGKFSALAINFRTKPRLLGILNKIFANEFATDGDISYRARYQELLPKPDADGADDSALCLVLPDADGDKKGNQYRAICALIAAATESAFPWSSEKPTGYGDFMVLARSRASVSGVVEQLRRANIPAVPLAEGDFYSAPEVRTILFLVDFLADTRRNGALHALLRSPAFCLSDGEIAHAFAMSEDGILWEKLGQYVREPSANERICRAYNIIGGLVSMSSEARPDIVIDKFLSADGVLAALCGEFPDITRPNIGKIVGQIKSFSVRAGMNFADISGALRAAREEDRAGYALPIETKDVVRVSTIHSAKGLEAKTVIIVDFDTSRMGGDSEKIYIEREFGNCPVLEPRDKSQRTCIHEGAKALNKDKDDAEMSRLFYVAMTRAKENVIVVGYDASNSFTSRVLTAFGGGYKKGFIPPDALPNGLIVMKASEIAAPPAEKITQAQQKKIDLSHPILVDGCKLAISVGRAAEFIVCPRRFYLARFGEDIPTEMSDDDAEFTPAREWGVIVHNFLSGAPFDSLEQAAQLAQKFPESARLVAIAENFIKLGLNEQLWRAQAMIETSLWLRHGNLIINGIADVILPDVPSVWDYKTGQSTPMKEALYSAQLNIYRLAVAQWKGISPNNVAAQIVWIGKEGKFTIETVQFCGIERLSALHKTVDANDESGLDIIENEMLCKDCKHKCKTIG